MMAARWKKGGGEKRSMKRELALNYCLKQNEMLKTVKFYKKFIFQNKRVSARVKLFFFCAIFSYLFFRKGDIFLSKIKLE